MPPSHTRWSKVNDSWVTLRSASCALVRPRLVDDPPDAEHGRLRVVDDRRGTVDAEHAVVVQREGPSGHLRRSERAPAGEVGELAQRAGQLGRRHRAGVVDDRYDEAARGLGGEAQVDPRELHDLLALGVDPGVQLREAVQPGHDDAGHQRQHADARVGAQCPDRVLGLHQRGRVGVDPGGRVGDLATAGGHPVGDGPTHAPQRDVQVVRGTGRPRTGGDGCGTRRVRHARARGGGGRRARCARGGGEVTAAEVGAGEACDDWAIAASTSRRRRISSGDPGVRVDRSTPCSRARRRTIGEMTWTARAAVRARGAVREPAGRSAGRWRLPRRPGGGGCACSRRCRTRSARRPNRPAPPRGTARGRPAPRRCAHRRPRPGRRRQQSGRGSSRRSPRTAAGRRRPASAPAHRAAGAPGRRAGRAGRPWPWPSRPRPRPGRRRPRHRRRRATP